MIQIHNVLVKIKIQNQNWLHLRQINQMLTYMKKYQYFVDGDLSDKFRKAILGIKQTMILSETNNMVDLLTK